MFEGNVWNNIQQIKIKMQIFCGDLPILSHYLRRDLRVIRSESWNASFQIRSRRHIPTITFMLLRRGWNWLQDKITSKARNFLLKILAAGPIPKHVAFVMDGNRRYARLNHKEIQEGHSDGFVALRRVRVLDSTCVENFWLY